MRNRDEPANGPMGLTKLEAAAFVAMQGILASPTQWWLGEREGANRREVHTLGEHAEIAVQMAHCLFNKLDGDNQPTEENHR